MNSIPESGKRGLSPIIFVAALVLALAAQSSFGAVAFRAATSANSASGTAVTITTTVGSYEERTSCGDLTPSIPAGSAGDLLVTQVVARRNATTVTMPGWNTLFSDNVAAADYQVFLFWRSATNTAADTNTVTQSGTCNHLMARITRFGNVDTAQPLETQPLPAGNWVYADANNVDTGTQNVTVANSMLVMATFAADNGNVTQDGSFTELYDIADGTNDDAGFSLNTRIETTTGSKGAFLNMALSSGTDPNHGVLFAVRPSPSVVNPTLTINRPGGGTTTGDVLVATVAVTDENVNISAPAGWTEVENSVQTQGGGEHLVSYWRAIADIGSEPASYTWTFLASHAGAVGGITAFSGVDTASPIVDSGAQFQYGNAATTHTAPSVAASAGDMLVTAHSYTSSGNWTPPVTMTPAVDIFSAASAGAGGVSLGMNYELRAVTGATGTRDATASNDGDEGVSHALALNALPTPVVVSISRADANPTPPGSAVSWAVTFSMSVTGVNTADFVLAATGVTGASITGVSGSGTTWTVTANTGSGTGTLGLNLVDDDTIVSGTSQPLGGAGAGNGNFTGEVYTVAIPTLSSVVNTYYPGTTASVAVGATSISLGVSIGSTTPISIGDTLLIMQMQDASLNSTNTDAYGDGTGGDLVGRGTTGVGGSGLYEYAIAASNVPVGGGTLTLACGTANAYTNAAATGTSGQKKYQVIRVPSYTSAILTSTLTASAWNGSAGGVLAFDASGALTLGSSTVSVNGLGFRGGATTTQTTGSGTNTDYRTPVSNNANGSKGEGIAGTPRYVFTSPDTRTDTGVEGYPNGSRARGAPSNAGGGATDRNPAANDENPGGGGGGNGGAGGIGGIGWCPGFTNTAPFYGCGLATEASALNLGGSTGGFGGATVSGLGATRLTLGGGGGGGTANNVTGSGACATVNGLCSSGVAGGGIIMIRAGSMTGSATFNANGSAGDDTVGNDGSGGGGAGGAVLISAGSGMGGVTINVAGGKGGDNLVSMSSNPHGPGGGGGGGYAITTSATASCSASGGANGVTYRNGTLFGAYGARSGGSGSCTTGLTAAQIPGTALGAADCSATVDHYLISHSGTGLTCEAEPVTFTAHDFGHARVDANGKTLSITTNTSSGTWLASADSCSQSCYDTSGTAAACAGSFTGSSGNNGLASYVFAGGEAGIRLCLKQNSAVTQNINASDGTASEATGTAGAEGGGADPDLVFGNTGIRIYAGGSVDTIGSQIAGVRNDDGTNHPATQVLTVRALKSGETTPARCVPLLTSVTHTLQFAYRCESSPSTCSASLPQGLEVNGTAVTGYNAASTPAPSDDVSVNFDANGHGSINLKYFDVGNISVWAHATSLADSTTGSTFAVVTGNSNTFAVKPYEFEVIPCAASVVGACTVAPANPGLAGGGGIFARAGETFKTTVTARALGGAKTYSFGRCDNSGGTGCAAASDVVTLSQSLAAPGGGSSGTLGGTTTPTASAFVTNAGSYTFTDLNWDEVGVITLKAANANYLSNGLGSCTTQTAGETCQGTFGASGNLGRFIPDHFDVELVSAAGVPMPCPTSLTCPANPLLTPRGYAYSGQPFSVQVTAKSMGVGGSTTQNYQGVYARDVTLSAWDALGSIVTPNPGSGLVGDGGITAATFTSGVAVTATPTYTFGTVPTVPTDIYVRATDDADGVSSRLATLPDSSVEPGLKIVSGRIKVSNAYGSERLPLTLQASAQYYTANGWVNSIDDSVTDLIVSASYIVGTGTSNTTLTPASSTLNNGVLSIRLSAPNVAGTATVLPGITGCTAPCAYMPVTAGTATFGVYSNRNNYIYRREN